MAMYPMTVQGADALREELVYLKQTKRPEIVASIAVAREHGDLKENAEYHAAREQQSFAEGRIKEIDAALSNAEIIDVIEIGSRVGDKIVFGATVELFDVGEDKDVTYKIVGELEADIKQNLISVTSPIARALIGKSVDDEVVVHAPAGDREYEITAVSYK